MSDPLFGKSIVRAFAAAVLLLAAMLPGAGCRSDAPSPNVTVHPARLNALDKADRVTRAKALLAEGKAYPRGCSEFVCDVLQIPWENADSLLGDPRVKVGKDNQYDDKVLVPGDVVGWNHVDGPADADGHGHVAIYIEKGVKQIIDVQGAGKAPRSIHGYGSQELYKGSKY